jgi:peptide deformylase
MKFSMKKIQTGINNPILRHISQEVEEITEELLSFCDKLLIEMRENKGVGLAAPQIGENIRVIATSQREKKPKKDKFL